MPSTLAIPENLVVTGTVNVDETTYGFSPKVLDRAMVLEFDDVDLGLHHSVLPPGGDETQGYRFPAELPPFRLATRDDYIALPEAMHDCLVAINGVLQNARLHFGYRTANEIALFMRTFHEFLPEDPKGPEDNWRRALDAAIIQKVLPRLSGNRAKIEAPLTELRELFRDFTPSQRDADKAAHRTPPKPALPRSYERSVEMLATLGDFGFVTFFK